MPMKSGVVIWKLQSVQFLSRGNLWDQAQHVTGLDSALAQGGLIAQLRLGLHVVEAI
jgi:hypothetical protein